MHWFLMLLIWALYTMVEGNSDQYATKCNKEYPSTDFTFCGKVPTLCQDSRYRSYDGSCNNLERSWYGTPRTPYWRPACSGNSSKIETIYDENYPSARKLSNDLFVDLEVEDQLWTLVFMQYGQITAHDLSLTLGVAQTKKDAVSCCTPEGKPIPEAKNNPRCAPIPIPEDDPYNGLEGRTCMDFFRVETTNADCVNWTGIPEPLTAVSSYIDGGYLYGNDEERARKVRAFKGGRLAYVTRNKKMVLPQDPEPELTCDVESKEEPCYYAGDVRVNQNPQLTLLHMLYMEHHNKIADGLAQLNPLWNDETLYQETRKIVIGIHHKITYYEFLPELIGKEYMNKNKLYYPDATGYIKDYDASVNPGVSNEFAACAFRIFHSEIVGNIKSLKENRNISDVISLKSWYNRPSICEHADNFNGLMRGMITQPQSAVDRYMDNDMLNLLFKEKGQLLGLDLKAIDIQRGRDQRVRSFADAVRACHLGDPQTWEDMEQFIKPKYIRALKRLYKSPSQLELCVALQLETSLPDSLVGPVAQCILGEQFYRTRVGDRCFFENGYGKCAFTPDQLKAIRNSSLAQIFCINKDITRIQPDPFKQISEKNPLMWCKDIPKFNLRPWMQINPFEY